MVSWYDEVLVRREQLLGDLFGLLSIESVKDEGTKSAEFPMGAKVGEALNYVLKLGNENGFETKNFDGFAGHLEYGPSDAEAIGILCHVDVVPATGEWKSPPFVPTVREGKIFARGAIDDKGPTMAAFYALKIVKELGLPLSKKVRMIFGTDEESGMSCMRYYKEVEGLPSTGFAPDADFPIINAEKGQISAKLTLTRIEDTPTEIELLSFIAGNRINMVPETATVRIKGKTETIQAAFEQLCEIESLKYKIQHQDDVLELTLYGISAHAMEPHIGVNTATSLAHFLHGFQFQENARTFINILKDLHKDFEGHSLRIAYEDEVTGNLTVNPGIVFFGKCGEASAQINVRCPVTTNYEETKRNLQAAVEEKGFNISELRESQPHFVSGDEPMVQALQKAYQEETGLEPTLLSTGGATYARFMEKGVAFGACFPGKEMTAHQKDEYIEIEDLLKATAIYARAIYELAK